MRIGVIYSSVLHAGVALFAVFGLPHVNDREVLEPDIIPVEIVNIEEETINKKPEEKPEPEPEPELEPERKAVAVAAEATPPPPPPADAVPLPDVEPEIEKKPEAKKVEKPQPQTPAASPTRKPRPPSRFDANRIALLLDKKAKEDQSEPDRQPDEKAIDKKVETASRSSIDKARLTASLQAAIRAQVEPCWSVPAGAMDAEDLKVRIRIFLSPDGSLAKAPQILDQTKMYVTGGDFYRVAAESARRAVQKCAPLKLPLESYDIWRDTELTFDPKELLEG